MKKTNFILTSTLLFIIFINNISAFAQDISGEWIGNSTAGMTYRMVLTKQGEKYSVFERGEKRNWWTTLYYEATFLLNIKNGVWTDENFKLLSTNAPIICHGKTTRQYTCVGDYEYITEDIKNTTQNAECPDYKVIFKRLRKAPCFTNETPTKNNTIAQQPNDCCTDPKNIVIESTDEHNATISWDAQPNAINYTVFYRKKGDNTWTEVTTTAQNNGVKLHNLPASTFFEVKVKTNCKENTTPIFNFSTQASKNNYYAVRNIVIDSIDTYNATVHWDAVPDAISYTLFYRNTMDNNWITVTTKNKNTGVRLHNLPENTQFECKVQTNCKAGNLSTDIEYFTTSQTKSKILESQIQDKIQRKIEIKHTITVQSKKIRISVWDNQKEDGDIISLYLNNDKIVDSLLLKTQKKEYIIDLTEKQNLLTLFAHTTGTEGPNTAAILIEDGYTAQNFVLNATLNQSEAMLINR